MEDKQAKVRDKIKAWEFVKQQSIPTLVQIEEETPIPHLSENSDSSNSKDLQIIRSSSASVKRQLRTSMLHDEPVNRRREAFESMSSRDPSKGSVKSKSPFMSRSAHGPPLPTPSLAVIPFADDETDEEVPASHVTVEESSLMSAPVKEADWEDEPIHEPLSNFSKPPPPPPTPFDMIMRKSEIPVLPQVTSVSAVKVVVGRKSATIEAQPKLQTRKSEPVIYINSSQLKPNVDNTRVNNKRLTEYPTIQKSKTRPNDSTYQNLPPPSSSGANQSIKRKTIQTVETQYESLSNCTTNKSSFKGRPESSQKAQLDMSASKSTEEVRYRKKDPSKDSRPSEPDYENIPEVYNRIRNEESLFQTRTKYKSVLDDKVDYYQRLPTKREALISAPLAATEEVDSSSDDEDEHEYYNMLSIIAKPLSELASAQLNPLGKEESHVDPAAAAVGGGGGAMTTAGVASNSRNYLRKEISSTPSYKSCHNAVLRTTECASNTGANSNSNPKKMSDTTRCATMTHQNGCAAMDEQNLTKRLAGTGPSRILWVNMLEVQKILMARQLTESEIRFQEVQFEIISSEASYFKSLGVLVHHFYYANEFSAHNLKAVITPLQKQHLFSNILQVYQASESFLQELESRWLESPVIDNICDIVLRFVNSTSADNNDCQFKPYLIYCRNQTYQSRAAAELQKQNREYCNTIRLLETSSKCQNQQLMSFLLLPMQRIVRLKMLVEQIVKRMPSNNEARTNEAFKTLGALQHLVKECNEEAKRMAETEDLVRLQKRLDFDKTRPLGIIADKRKILKEATLKVVDSSSSALKFLNLRPKNQFLHLIALSDYLLITKPRSDERLQVIDHRPRRWIKPYELKELRDGKFCFELTLLKSCGEEKQKSYFFEVEHEGDRARWVRLFEAQNDSMLDEKIYDEWDQPQVQVTKPYTAKEPDELTINVNDIINVFKKKTSDGWYEGLRSADGLHGWFPADCVEELENEHFRAKFAKQSFRRSRAERTFQESQRVRTNSRKTTV